MDEKQPQAGEKIALALKLLRQAYSEAGLLLCELDNFMREHGWEPVYGNRTTRDVTSHLDNPTNWLLQGTFRYYQNHLSPLTDDPITRLGITIVWWQDAIEDDLDPFVIIGRTEGLEIDMEHWDLWTSWFQDDDPEEITKSPISGVIDGQNVSFCVSAKFLTTISNKQDVASLGQQLLDLLNTDSV